MQSHRSGCWVWRFPAEPTARETKFAQTIRLRIGSRKVPVPPWAGGKCECAFPTSRVPPSMNTRHGIWAAGRHCVYQILRLLLVQLTSTNRHAGNIATVSELVAIASSEESRVLVLPEGAGIMNRNREEAITLTTVEAADPFIGACRELAHRFGIWIHVGTAPVRTKDELLNHSVLLNNSVLLNSAGNIRVRCVKIHFFGIFLEGRPATRESDRYAPGTNACLVDTPWRPRGPTICFDLRFPSVFRDYAKGGATVILEPSAFTVPTGRAHCEPLIRARAIKNGCWIVASAQVGTHDDGRLLTDTRLSWTREARSLPISGGEAPGHKTLDLDLGRLLWARRQVPSLSHGRPTSLSAARFSCTVIQSQHSFMIPFGFPVASALQVSGCSQEL